MKGSGSKRLPIVPIKHACYCYLTVNFFAYLERVTPEGDKFISKLQHVDDPE